MTSWTRDELARIGSADELDGAYRRKYRRNAPNVVNSVLTPGARSATVELVPR
jgi:hypothetical protein